MTVSELMEYLSDFDDDKEVFFQHSSMDHWNTQLASSVENVEIGYIEFSNYHRQNKVKDIEDTDDQDDAKEIILIS